MPKILLYILLILFLLLLLLNFIPAQQGFLGGVQHNIKKAFTPSEFVCDKYERQEFERLVLRPGAKLPFTEVKSKKRTCIEWEAAPKSAIGRTCKKYSYENSSPDEQQHLYMKVKRYRTVCVEGHSTR